MEIPSLQTWIIFYLISFVLLLWAAFLSAEGSILWVTFFLVIVVTGVNFWVVYSIVKRQAAKKELQKFLTKDILRE